MRRRLALLAGLLLAGCGTLDATRARYRLVGANEADIIACMGVPAERQALGPYQSVLQWDYAQSGDDVDLELGVYELKLGRPGICHAVIRFDGSLVQSVHFAGASITATNPDSICGRLVSDCLHHLDVTPLPSFFDPDRIATTK